MTNGASPTTDGFEAFYAAYPRHVAPDAAQRAWRTALKRATPAEIMAGLGRQLPELRAREVRFIPHPATWLNQGRWRDEEGPPAPTTPARSPARPPGGAQPWFGPDIRR